MAIFTPGPLVSALSGTLGSVTFKVGPHANVLAKARTVRPPVLAPTLQQQSIYPQLVAAWTALTFQQRAPWHTAAATFVTPNRLGVRRRLSAFQLYMKVNLPPSAAVFRPLLLPPQPLILQPRVSISFNFTFETSYQIKYSPTGTTAATHGDLYAAPLFRTSDAPSPPPLRFIASDLADNFFHDFRPEWLKIFDDFQHGQFWHFRIILSNLTGSFPGGRVFLREESKLFVP